MIDRIVRVMADCDSKGFTALSEVVQEVYVPMKLQDKSHFKKKFERAVISVETELGKNTLLKDGRTLGGAGRLTKVQTKKMANQIAQNLIHHVNRDSTEQEVSNQIWQVYHHRISSDEKPDHR